MKSIFDALDEIQKGNGGVIHKLHYNDGGKLSMALMVDNPMDCHKEGWFLLDKQQAIVINFSQKDSTITRTTRPDKNMQMNLYVIMRPTFIPMDSALKVEIFETQEDIADIVDMVQNLRNTFEGVTKKPSLILPE